jgi:hypothetical protein
METAHPRKLDLDRLSVDDVPPDLRATLDGHVAACADCRAYVAELEADAAAHRGRSHVAFVDAVRARRTADLRRARRRRLVASGGAIAAAAAIAVVVVVARGGDEARVSGDTTFKGSAGVAIHVKRGDRIGVLGAGDRVRAGDAVRVVVSLPVRSPVAAWMVDDTGRVDDVVAAPVVLDAGTAALPGSLVLEAPCRDSVVVIAVGAASKQWTADRVRGEPRLHPRSVQPPPSDLRVVALRCEP